MIKDWGAAYNDIVQGWFSNRMALNLKLSYDRPLKAAIAQACILICKAIREEKKILIFGNGGSAAEAQHFAAELVCKFEKDRPAIATIALTTDGSILTAQSNDYGFESVFARQIDAFCCSGDVVIGLTTSDAGISHSKNIQLAFEMARKKKGVSIGLFSQKTTNLLGVVDVAIIVPDNNTALIQEAHLAIIHLLCKLIEEEI